MEKSPLAGNKDKFSFSFSNRKLLRYVRAWAGWGHHTGSHITSMPALCMHSILHAANAVHPSPCATQAPHHFRHIHHLHTPVDIPNHISVYMQCVYDIIHGTTHTHTHYIVTSTSTVYTRHASHTPCHIETFLYPHHIPILNAYNTSIPQVSHMLHAIYMYTNMSIYMFMYTDTPCHRHISHTYNTVYLVDTLEWLLSETPISLTATVLYGISLFLLPEQSSCREHRESSLSEGQRGSRRTLPGWMRIWGGVRTHISEPSGQ